jgi:hypothetical protein
VAADETAPRSLELSKRGIVLVVLDNSARSVPSARHPMTTPARKPIPLADQKPAAAVPATPKPPTNPFTAGHPGKKQRQQAHADTNAVLRQRNKK